MVYPHNLRCPHYEPLLCVVHDSKIPFFIHLVGLPDYELFIIVNLRKALLVCRVKLVTFVSHE